MEGSLPPRAIPTGDHAPVEIAAFVVSAAALLVSVALPLALDSREAPHIRLVGQRALVFAEGGGSAYALHVFNGGRAPVDIVGWGMTGEGHRDPRRHPGFANGTPGGNESLPTTVAPYSSVSFWRTREIADPVLVDPEHGAADVKRLRGFVDLSTGVRLHARTTIPAFDLPRRRRDPYSLRARMRRRILRREPAPLAEPHV